MLILKDNAGAIWIFFVITLAKFQQSEIMKDDCIYFSLFTETYQWMGCLWGGKKEKKTQAQYLYSETGHLCCLPLELRLVILGELRCVCTTDITHLHQVWLPWLPWTKMFHQPWGSADCGVLTGTSGILAFSALLAGLIPDSIIRLFLKYVSV